jgi:signal transduction histidine kinase
VLVLAVVALEVPLAASTADRIEAEVRSQARGQADLVAASAAGLLPRAARPQLQRLVDAAARSVRGRVIVVGARGALLADSERTTPGRSYAARPELVAALAGRADQRERASATLGRQVLFTAVPIGGVRPVGAVRITQGVDAVDRAVRRAWLGLALIGLLVLALGLAAGAVVANGIVRPLRRLDAAVRRVGGGDLTARAPVTGSAEQQALARTFNDMTARLDHLVTAQRDFVADASHQLRTPLTGLRLRVEGVRDADPEEVDAALLEVDRLARVVDELLVLSRADEPGAGAELLELRGVLDAAAARWAPIAHGRGQAVRVAEGPAPRARIAREDADRIVDALLENALRYAPEGAGVELATLPRGLEVRDRGPGLGPDELERVFERFRRGTAGRQGAAGTGLGLPIARGLARRWGGDVHLLPRPGGGTVARVDLPGPED